MGKNPLEAPEQFRADVPAWASEVGTRIAALLEAVGGLEAARKICGVSTDTLANWRDGRSRPAFLPLAMLCQAAGKSLDWLATGAIPVAEPAPPSALDEELLSEVIDLIEGWLELHERHLPATAKAKAISAAYELCAERVAATDQKSTAFAKTIIQQVMKIAV